ncbi:MAG: FAD-dependent oxidoreductase [Desulfobacterales bacterium]|nr:FAD-dependent oxidoreductase [Desulfobacterales bacterium]
MTVAILFMLGLGAACGVILTIAARVFYVYEDPRISEVEACLAGANCGGCGYPGCSGAAVAVVAGKAPASVCIIAGPEAATQVGAVMGMAVSSVEPLRSLNMCLGGQRATNQYHYLGVNSCRAVATLYGGQRDCRVGCIGLGDCVKSCKFDALALGPDGYPVVDQIKCVGCGACEKVCPKNILNVRTMSHRLLHLNEEDDALAPCRQTCPAEIDIPKYIAHIRMGDYDGAVHTIKERNPLLLTCGRVCPHPCEDYCRRGVEDEAVSINQLKRFVADREMNSGTRLPVRCAPETGKKVAIIGAGPAGLSCAYFLRRLGHQAAIFEAMPELGGMLRYGIPEYRLPKKVLDWEIEGILNLGVEVKTSVRFGRDFDLDSLSQEAYDAVFLGVGAWKDYGLGVEGENLSGCFTGINFLIRIATGESVPVGKKCAVIGGGNTAIDCVRTLVRLGAEEVYIIYRRTRAEMPANRVEIEAAGHEGVKFHFLAAPVKVIGDENNKITHLEYLKMELGEPDASGRRRPVPVEGSETRIQLDMLITAVGQGPDVSFVGESKGLEDLKITRWNTIETESLETLQSSIPKIFTGGDSATGASLVVEAIGAGRRAARSIHQYLTGQAVTAPEKSLFKKHIPESIFKSVEGLQKIPRTKMPELPVEVRTHSFAETDLVISKNEAAEESQRCLFCCRLCYNKDKESLAA